METSKFYNKTVATRKEKTKMGLFSKKITLDDILKALPELSDEERAALHEKTGDLYKAEDEREIDKIEEEKADSDTEADEKAEEVKEESKEIGKDVDEIEEEAAEDGDPEAEEAEAEKEDEGDGAEPFELEENKPEVVEPPLDESEKDNSAEVIKALTDRVGSLETNIKELMSLKSAMEEYVGKQKEAFGYKSDVRGDKKDYADMSADELKAQILHG
jgi:hypothetical protein